MNPPLEPGARVAIVGSGVSGLVAAHLLRDRFEIDVFEADERIGGHVYTVDERDARGRSHAVDTGFIVFNDVNYPRFCALMDELGVASQPSDMSFGVRCEASGFEYSGTGFTGLFAQKRNVLRPSHWGMVREILRFFREAPRLLAGEPDLDRTLRDYLDEHGYGRRFVEQFIVPMGAAIWSATRDRILQFPAVQFVRFFNHHRMLQVRGRPAWRVLRGGSRTYVEALTRPFRDRIHTSTPVLRVERRADGVDLRTNRGPASFDAVVLAVHSDQALRMLGDPRPAEREILGAVGYQANDLQLHTDVRVLPRARRARAAWNVHLPADAATARSADPVAVTYDMNTLQSLAPAADARFLVTLNRPDLPDAATVRRSLRYEHPVFDAAAVRAQARHREISGVDRTYYCGAWWGYGFHEDGVRSGERVAHQMGARTLLPVIHDDARDRGAVA